MKGGNPIENWNALIDELNNGDLEQLKRILDSHNINQQDPSNAGNTPLHLFLNLSGNADREQTMKDIAIIKWMTEMGADVNKKNLKRQTPMALALKRRNYTNVKFLIDLGALPDEPYPFADCPKMTPLGQIATWLSRNDDNNDKWVSIAKILIKRGAEINNIPKDCIHEEGLPQWLVNFAAQWSRGRANARVASIAMQKLYSKNRSLKLNKDTSGMLAKMTWDLRDDEAWQRKDDEETAQLEQVNKKAKVDKKIKAKTAKKQRKTEK